MSVFDPESSHNRFWAVLEDLRDTADLFQWQDALNEAWEEYAGVSV